MRSLTDVLIDRKSIHLITAKHAPCESTACREKLAAAVHAPVDRKDVGIRCLDRMPHVLECVSYDDGKFPDTVSHLPPYAPSRPGVVPACGSRLRSA